MRRGFTLVEAVLSLAVMSMVLLMVGAFIVQNQRIALRNLLQNEAVEDGRRSMLRLSEIVSQASYIYPNNQTIAFPSGTVVTGNAAMAVLLPWGSSYCQGDISHKAQYCAFLYLIEGRSYYASMLATLSQGAGSVLVEKKLGWLDWPAGTLPATDLSTLSYLGVGVVTDGVVSASSVLGNLSLSANTAGIDNGVLTGTQVNDPAALIGAVRPKLVISYLSGLNLSQEVDITARTIPRITNPGMGN